MGPVAEGAPQQVELGQQHRRLGRLVDQEVELPVGPARLVGVVAPRQALVQVVQLAQGLVADTRGGQVGAQALEGGPDLGILVQPRVLRSHDHRGPVGLGDDVSLSLQSPERLPHRCRAHPEHVGDLALAQEAARLDLAALDHLLEGFCHQVGLALVWDVSAHQESGILDRYGIPGGLSCP